MTRHTYDMGIVGNCAYLAHIDTLARVRWLCLTSARTSFA